MLKSLFKTAWAWGLKKVAIWLAIVIVTILLVSKAYGYVSGYWGCASQWSDSGMEYRYGFRSGCMIKPGDAWIPAKNYRG